MVVHSSDNNDRCDNRNHHLIRLQTRVQTSKGPSINNVIRLRNILEPSEIALNTENMLTLQILHVIVQGMVHETAMKDFSGVFNLLDKFLILHKLASYYEVLPKIYLIKPSMLMSM